MVLFRFYLLINMPDATRAIILPQTLIKPEHDVLAKFCHPLSRSLISVLSQHTSHWPTPLLIELAAQHFHPDTTFIYVPPS